MVDRIDERCDRGKYPKDKLAVISVMKLVLSEILFATIYFKYQ